MSRSDLRRLPHVYRPFYRAFVELRPLQREAIAPLLEGRDAIVQAPTGSGKTEAVLAPLVERLIVGGLEAAILYIVPTRALAMDLRRRLAPVFEELGLVLAVRTGDAKWGGQGARPSLLLTTPESLDVALGSPNAAVRDLLRRVEVVVIDEAHALTGSARGVHLSMLLQRLARRVPARLQRVALSATIADAEGVRVQFKLSASAVQLRASGAREVEGRVVHLQDEEREAVDLVDDLHKVYAARKLLIFANSRSRCDRLVQWLEAESVFSGAVLLHYSNLQPAERKAVERRFRRSDKAVCVATSTLELGIDVGDVDAVVLYEPPETASAFVQRIGRSGRRSGQVRWWGVCRGESAALQALQFAALEAMARSGDLEAAPARELPSVVAQQVASCLYDQRHLTGAALAALWPRQAAWIEAILPAMEASRWLKPTSTRRGGHRRGPAPPEVTTGVERVYGAGRAWVEAWKDQKIFSNFPPSEESFAVRLASGGDDGARAETLAEIPRSVVRQLKVGDRVYLVGRRLEILEIVRERDAGSVLVRPTRLEETRQLFWSGVGLRVPWEVAQEARRVLQEPEDAWRVRREGMFRRPGALLEGLRGQLADTVGLANGFRLGRTAWGMWRAWTFFGAFGNLVLRHAIERQLGPEVHATHDAFGVETTEQVSFEALELPRTSEEFEAWVEGSAGLLSDAVAMNAFCDLLPRELQVAELTLMLHHPPLLQALAHVRSTSSRVVDGDVARLWGQGSSPSPTSTAPSLAQGRPAPETLESERLRFAAPGPLPPRTSSGAPTVTATQLAGFVGFALCARRLVAAVDGEESTVAPSPAEAAARAARQEQGRMHEAAALAALGERGNLVEIASHDARGRVRPLGARARQTRAALASLVAAAAGGEAPLAWLAHGVLTAPLGGDGGRIVGVPDLIEVRASADGVVRVAVGDIKAATRPSWSHRWQVATYDHLLSHLDVEAWGATVRQSAEGFVLARAPTGAGTSAGAVRHDFDLGPYRDCMAAVLERVSALVTATALADYRLGGHCAACELLPRCYGESLHTEELRLVTALSGGERAALHARGARTLLSARTLLKQERLFGALRQERLAATFEALVTGEVRPFDSASRWGPTSASVWLWHGVDDPQSGELAAAGWCRCVDGRVIESGAAAASEESGGAPFLWARSLAQLAVSLSTWAPRGARPWVVVATAERRRALLDHPLPADAGRAWQDLTVERLVDQLVARLAMPRPGRSGLEALGAALGLDLGLPPRPSLLHPDADSPQSTPAARLAAELGALSTLWAWATGALPIRAELGEPTDVSPTASAWLAFVRRERKLAEEKTQSIQRLGFIDRRDAGHAIGPLRYLGSRLGPHGEVWTAFERTAPGPLARFRAGDFLRLAPFGALDLQSGVPVVLEQDDTHTLALSARLPGWTALRGLDYTLESDLTDFNTPRVEAAITAAFSPRSAAPIVPILLGGPVDGPDPDRAAWLGRWWQAHGAATGLNPAQRRALELAFSSPLALIEGPPGTGKTHLIAWLLVAMLRHAVALGHRLHIAVTALTHTAIDTVLARLAPLLSADPALVAADVRCFKWGRTPADLPTVDPLHDRAELSATRLAVVGATGPGLYRLLGSGPTSFDPHFDAMVCDEASQLRLTEALLATLHAHARFVFVGDTRQLPPILHGEPEAGDLAPSRSILAHLLGQGRPCRVLLDRTYRMSAALCAFPSHTWYADALISDATCADARLDLTPSAALDLLDRIVAPDPPMTLVLVDHEGCRDHSPPEAHLVVALVNRLRLRGLADDALAVISPHRVQNNAIRTLLLQTHASTPTVDTVERMQGQEADCVIFSLTASDDDHIQSAFLNDPNRFNVAITRARKKLIVIASHRFFALIPHDEETLQRHRCFKAFLAACKADGDVVRLTPEDVLAYAPTEAPAPSGWPRR